MISGEGCILEDLAVTGNVFDLSPLGMPGEDKKDYFAVKGKNSDEYTIKVIYPIQKHSDILVSRWRRKARAAT